MSARNHGGEPANYEHTKQRPLSIAIARSATFEPLRRSSSSRVLLSRASSKTTALTHHAGWANPRSPKPLSSTNGVNRVPRSV